jgi:hypothetical protein
MVFVLREVATGFGACLLASLPAFIDRLCVDSEYSSGDQERESYYHGTIVRGGINRSCAAMVHRRRQHRKSFRQPGETYNRSSLSNVHCLLVNCQDCSRSRISRMREFLCSLDSNCVSALRLMFSGQ